MTAERDITAWQEIDAKLHTNMLVVLVMLCVWYYGPDGLELLDLGIESDLLRGGFRILVTIAVLMLIPTLFKTPLQALGFSRPRILDLKVFASFALLSGGVFALFGLAFFGVAEYAPSILDGVMPPGEPLERVAHFAFPDLDLFGVAMTVLALPVMEEIFFRGMIYPHLRREFSARIAVIATALIFALAHAKVLPVSQLIGGLFFAMAFEMTARLWAPIALHILGNGSLYLLSELLKQSA